MKKHILDLIVKRNLSLNDQYHLIVLGAESVLPDMYPGQFVEVKVENAPNTFLRRPISVNYFDKINNEIWLLIQKVGEGTHVMCELKVGEMMNIIAPLGNTFSEPSDKSSEVLLVGGGVGTAPMLFLGSVLNSKGYKCNFLLGGRSSSNLLQLEEFEKYGTVYTTTEDGSHGEKGFVTNHSVLESVKFDAIYTCGPTPMMKAVANYAESKNIHCEVSLENTMACGFGACLCCVTNTTDGHLCVCTDGPVFNIEKLKW